MRYGCSLAECRDERGAGYFGGGEFLEQRGRIMFGRGEIFLILGEEVAGLQERDGGGRAGRYAVREKPFFGDF